MTKQEIYNEVKAEFLTMTLPAPYIPPSIANAKIAAYNSYKSWLENNNPSNNPSQDDTINADNDYFMAIYNSPY